MKKDITLMRRLYRILIFPTLDFIEPNSSGKRKPSIKVHKKNRKRKNGNSASEQAKEKKDVSFDEIKGKLATSLIRSLNSVYIRDLLMSFVNFSTEIKISDFVSDQLGIRQILGIYSPVLHEFFEKQSNVTPLTIKIAKVDWITSTKKKFITFRKSTQITSTDEVEEIVLSKFLAEGLSLENRKKVQVQVSVLNADWLL